MDIRAIYNFACVNCGGEITDSRLLELGVCPTCLKTDGVSLVGAAELLKESGKLMRLKEFLDLHLAYEDFRRFFKAALGFEPWALQEIWAKRILLGHNFAIVAPTGIGKTVLGLIMALYLLSKGRRCYVMVPSSILVQQLYEKALNFAERAESRKLADNIVAYHAGIPRSEKEEALKKIEELKKILLITTDRFLIDHGELLKGKFFDFVFVDDVDSFLKSPKNIDRAIGLLGLRPEAIDLALRLIELRMKLAKTPSSELTEMYRNLESRIESEKRRRKGILVVSGATLKGRKTKRLMIFEELLDFEVGRFQEFVRNVEDMYLEVDPSRIIDEAINIVKRHGGGCLVFVPHALGRAYAAKVAKMLEKAGVKVYTYEKMETDILQRFSDGEIDVMVGLAASRSPLTRGIDLPARIRYALFIGVPRREIRISRDEYNPTKLLILINNILPVLDRKIRSEAEAIIARLMKITPLNRELVEKIKNACEREESLGGFEKYAQEVIVSTRNFLNKILTRDFIEKIESELDITLRPVEDGFSLVIPDTIGYIQASGRTSRLYPYGVAKGASIILVDEKRAFKGLITRLKAQLEEIEFEPYTPENAELTFKQIDNERKLIRELLSGRVEVKAKDVVRAALMLVESPTKARTIAHLFGRPFSRKVGNMTVHEAAIGGVIVGVAATQGHLTDLVTGRGLHGIEELNGRFVPIYGLIKRCLNCGEQWADGGEKCPSCGSDEVFNKGEIVEAIRKLALQYNDIYIATDPDAEGEKIAYDLFCIIKPYNPRIYRLEFHEVTRRALLTALQNKRNVNTNLVESQLLRRIEDRWIGFELSMKLWDRFGSKWLSAGRVQTPVLGWIVSATKQAQKKLPLLTLRLKDGPTIEILDPENLEGILDAWERGELRVTIKEVIEGRREVNPPPPYTTDSLLRDAFTYLRLSAMDAMRVAQELFEAGLITYHRTDATTVSQVGLGIAREYLSQAAPDLFAPRTHRMEGAHECIRPVKPLDSEKLRYYVRIGLLTIPARRLTDVHFNMYDLIFRRFVASQCKPATVLTQKFKAEVLGNEVELVNDVEIVEAGFLKFFPTIRTRAKVDEGEYEVAELEVRRVPATRLLTEGDAITMMKEKGIGRPSTYSKIIETLLQRGYVIERAGRLIATRKGMSVYNFLIEKFEKYISEELTRKLEADMDLVEKGEINYQDVLRKLYEEVVEIKKTPVVAER